MFLVIDVMDGKLYWFRTGISICYYKNYFIRSVQVIGGVKGKIYYIVIFIVIFKYDKDICYFVYYFFYIYIILQVCW